MRIRIRSQGNGLIISLKCSKSPFSYQLFKNNKYKSYISLFFFVSGSCTLEKKTVNILIVNDLQGGRRSLVSGGRVGRGARLRPIVTDHQGQGSEQQNRIIVNFFINFSGIFFP